MWYEELWNYMWYEDRTICDMKIELYVMCRYNYMWYEDRTIYDVKIYNLWNYMWYANRKLTDLYVV